MGLDKCTCSMETIKCSCRIVLISDFCRQFAVKQSVQQCFGLHNAGVKRISEERFEDAKRAFRKRFLDESPVAKRVCLAKDVESGPQALCSDPADVQLLYTDSSTYCHETIPLHAATFPEFLNEITLISSPCGKSLEPENSDRFFLLQSEEYTKDSSPPVDFSFTGA